MNSSEKIIQIRLILANPELDPDEALRMIKHFTNNQTSRVLVNKYSLDQIRDLVCEYSGLTFAEIMHATKRSEIVIFRQLSQYKAFYQSVATLNEIGYYFSNADHCMAKWSIKTIQDRLDTNREFKQKHETFLNN